MTSLLIFLLCLISTSSTCLDPPTSKLNILAVFPHPGLSHFHFFRELLNELHKRGHQLTVISHFPRNNLNSSSYRDIDLRQAGELYKDAMDLGNFEMSTLTRIPMEIAKLRDWGLDYCRRTLNNPKVKELIRSKDAYDLVITEVFNSDCGLGFVHRFNAPFVALSSHELLAWADQRMGNVDNPSHIPAWLVGLSPRMSFAERLINSLASVYLNFAFTMTYVPPTQRLLNDAFGPGDVPSIVDIAKQTSAILVNTHYSLHGARPMLPNVVQVGGIHIPRGVGPLPSDVEEFLDGASEGVLLFSWGSMIRAASMPTAKLLMILKVIKELPRRVLWKFEDEKLPHKLDNLLIKKWLPQFDVLSK